MGELNERFRSCVENLKDLTLSPKKGKPVAVEIIPGSESITFIHQQSRKRLHALTYDDIVYVVELPDKSVEVAALVKPGSDGACGCSPGTNSTDTDRQLVQVSFHSSCELTMFVEILNQLSFGKPVRRAKAVVVVNPVSGRGSARSDWERTVEPLLKRSGKFDYEVVVTEHSGHAIDIGADLIVRSSQSLPENEKLFIISIGGDGVVYELLNGIKNACPNTYLSVLNRLVLCPLPSGSGNGLSYSALCLAGESFSMNCALRLLLRQKYGAKDLGLVTYDCEDPFAEHTTESRLFALTLSWGLVADVDIQSEFLRKYVGGFRFTLYGLFRVLKKQLYEGTLSCDNGFHEIEPDYLTVYATLVPVAGKTVILSTDKPLDDGQLRVHRLRGRDVSRVGLISAMSELEKRRDHSKRIPGFDPIVTSGFELQPGLVKVPNSAGIVVDGEPLTSSAVKVSIIPRACSIFSSQ